MATAREVPQFSMVEALAFAKAFQPPTTPREMAMAQFAQHVAKQGDDAFKASGGIDNVQRIRVLGDPFKPLDQQKLKYEFALKLPLNILEQKRRETEREKRKQEVIARARELANDPKKLDEFVRKVAKAILGAAAFELLKLSKGHKVSTKKLNAPPRKRKQLTKEEVFERARRQDRYNRIEAAKAAAESYRAAHPKAVQAN